MHNTSRTLSIIMQINNKQQNNLFNYIIIIVVVIIIIQNLLTVTFLCQIIGITLLRRIRTPTDSDIGLSRMIMSSTVTFLCFPATCTMANSLPAFPVISWSSIAAATVETTKKE